MYFPISGLQLNPLIPLLAGFVVASFCSLGGITGAFLILPFQISVLGFVSPAVSATNLFYNIISIPSGVYAYFRKGQVVWPLASVILISSIPGVSLGAIIRVRYMPDPKTFKLFVGLVLFYIGYRLIIHLFKKQKKVLDNKNAQNCSNNQLEKKENVVNSTEIKNSEVISKFSYFLVKRSFIYEDKIYSFNLIGVALLSFIVAIIGGAYGIGGGALMSPILITFFSISVYAVSGATLIGTFFTSVIGILFYTFVAPLLFGSAVQVKPDWLLGLLFGIGGSLGMYLGARIQRYIPQKAIEAMLGIIIIYLASNYIISYFS